MQGRGLPWLCQAWVFPDYPIQGPLCRGRRLLWQPKAIFRLSKAMSSTAVRVFFACPGLCLLRLSVSSLRVQGYVFYGCPCLLCMSRAMSSTAVRVFFACPGLCFLLASVAVQSRAILSPLAAQSGVFFGCPSSVSLAVRVVSAYLLYMSKVVFSCLLWLAKTFPEGVSAQQKPVSCSDVAKAKFHLY